MSKFYAVKSGKVPGIYTTWDECKAQVDKYPGAVYKSFNTIDEAKSFMGLVKEEEKTPYAYAYVDGSYNPQTCVYGYGGFLMVGDEKYVLSGSDNNTEMASMRNVAGEICGSMAAIRKALELGLDELCIYYDYMGIECWALGTWKRNKEGTIAYHEFYNSVKDKIHVVFKKVVAHSNVAGNEEADRLAKQAVKIQD